MNIDFADLLLEVVDRRASDLHLTAGAPPMVRVRGRLQAVDGYPTLTPTDTREIVYSILSNDQRQKLENNWQLDFAYQIPGQARFRVNAYFQRSALGAAFRLIPFEISPLESLGLPPAVAEEERGLVLVTGPTGSGKSTTLAALVDHVNATRSAHVMTIEDPIEFLHRDNRAIVSQREVAVDTRSFAHAVRSALRQDPDVILVGELRDLETIEIALVASETGHLVFSALHTLDAVETITRIIAQFPPHQQAQVRMQLASVLRAVISQRLLPRADGRGRAVAVEVMVSTPAIRECIVHQEKTALLPKAIAEGGAQHGMQTFDQAIFRLLEQHLVTREEALRWTSTGDALARRAPDG